MPYKYVKTQETPPANNELPKITETKEVEIPKPMTEDEYQEQHTNEHSKTFFDEDEEIIEVNWD